METSKKHLIQYYSGLQKQCVKHAKSIKDKFTRGDIHDFRVTIKKLKAFKAFINFIEPEFKIRDASLEKIYKSAGKLRTYNLLKEELKTLKLYDTNWKKFFTKKIEIAKEDYKNIFTEFRNDDSKNFKKEKDRILFILTEEIKLEEKGNTYLKSLLDTMNDFKISNLPGKSPLHDFRKLMKEFGYNYLLLNEAFYLPMDENFIKEINKFNKVLGKWHDKVVFRKFILKQKNYARSDRLAEQVGLDIHKTEGGIVTEINKFRLQN